jgi:hypothetical protein
MLVKKVNLYEYGTRPRNLQLKPFHKFKNVRKISARAVLLFCVLFGIFDTYSMYDLYVCMYELSL